MEKLDSNNLHLIVYLVSYHDNIFKYMISCCGSMIEYDKVKKSINRVEIYKHEKHGVSVSDQIKPKYIAIPYPNYKNYIFNEEIFELFKYGMFEHIKHILNNFNFTWNVSYSEFFILESLNIKSYDKNYVQEYINKFRCYLIKKNYIKTLNLSYDFYAIVKVYDLIEKIIRKIEKIEENINEKECDFSEMYNNDCINKYIDSIKKMLKIQYNECGHLDRVEIDKKYLFVIIKNANINSATKKKIINVL